MSLVLLPNPFIDDPTTYKPQSAQEITGKLRKYFKTKKYKILHTQ